MRVRVGGGDKRGADEPEETRTAESWGRDVGVRRVGTFAFVSFASACRTARTAVQTSAVVSVGALRHSASGLGATEGPRAAAALRPPARSPFTMTEKRTARRHTHVF